MVSPLTTDEVFSSDPNKTQSSTSLSNSKSNILAVFEYGILSVPVTWTFVLNKESWSPVKNSLALPLEVVGDDFVVPNKTPL